MTWPQLGCRSAAMRVSQGRCRNSLSSWNQIPRTAAPDCPCEPPASKVMLTSRVRLIADRAAIPMSVSSGPPVAALRWSAFASFSLRISAAVRLNHLPLRVRRRSRCRSCCGGRSSTWRRNDPQLPTASINRIRLHHRDGDCGRRPSSPHQTICRQRCCRRTAKPIPSPRERPSAIWTLGSLRRPWIRNGSMPASQPIGMVRRSSPMAIASKSQCPG